MSDETIRRNRHLDPVTHGRELYRRGHYTPVTIQKGRYILESLGFVEREYLGRKWTICEALVLESFEGPHKAGDIVLFNAGNSLRTEVTQREADTKAAIDQVASRWPLMAGLVADALNSDETYAVQLIDIIPSQRRIDTATVDIISRWDRNDPRWRIVCRRAPNDKVEIIDGWTRVQVAVSKKWDTIPVVFVRD